MPGSSLEGVSSTPLLQAARATSKRRLEKAADVVMKECGTLAVHVLYGLHVASSYLLMLAAMTFNVGVFVAVCSGTAPIQGNTRARQFNRHPHMTIVYDSAGFRICCSGD